MGNHLAVCWSLLCDEEEALNIRGSCLGQSHGRWDQGRVEKRTKEGGKVGEGR